MKMTQKQEVIRWLKEGWTITPAEALSSWGCFRLAAVIKKLRDKGQPFFVQA